MCLGKAALFYCGTPWAFRLNSLYVIGIVLRFASSKECHGSAFNIYLNIPQAAVRRLLHDEVVKSDRDCFSMFHSEVPSTIQNR